MINLIPVPPVITLNNVDTEIDPKVLLAAIVVTGLVCAFLYAFDAYQRMKDR